MWDFLAALLFPILAILWVNQWPLSDEGFALLFLALLLWQARRDCFGLRENQEKTHNMHRPKKRLEGASPKVRSMGHGHPKDRAEVVRLLKRRDMGMFCGKSGRTICQRFREEAHGVFLEDGTLYRALPLPPAGREKLTRPGLSFHRSRETASRPHVSKSGKCSCSSKIMILPSDEGPQTPQLEEKRQQHREPGFPPSGHRTSEVSEEEAHSDAERTSPKRQREAEGSTLGIEPPSQPSLLNPKTRSFLEQHLKAMLHFQQYGLPSWVMEAQSQLAPQAGERDIQPGSPWRKDSVVPEDSRRVKMLKSKKEALEEHMAQKCHQLRHGEIPSEVHNGQGDTSTSPPLALPASPGPPTLSGPRSPAPIIEASPPPGLLDTGPQSPDQGTASPMLSSSPRLREDQSLPVEPSDLPEASMRKSLESVTQQNHVDVVSGCDAHYGLAADGAGSPAGPVQTAVSPEDEPGPDTDLSGCSVVDREKEGTAEEPKLSPIAEHPVISMDSRADDHSHEVGDSDGPQDPTAQVPEQEREGPGLLGSRHSKPSPYPPKTAFSLRAPVSNQRGERGPDQSHSKASVSSLAERGPAPVTSCGPGVSTSRPVSNRKGQQPPPRASFSEQLKTWFGSKGQQADISPRARTTAALGEPGKRSSASPGTTKPSSPAGSPPRQPMGFTSHRHRPRDGFPGRSPNRPRAP
ncbi:calmodulin-regulated spectrin-associated protein 3-like isoform X2 [Tachyglossus aculeatus]|uniref:calmodulin-regulated spectrin-associated protein 3-like isoform X2 n=1 Tax=Tachyglossus aculeatus TaxID=9261 RepID=UPI0018F4DB11|nr:calmodulin-regulated spectrin-associated protein 3-like isoform X2 [Tachyglossus aculeatus]